MKSNDDITVLVVDDEPDLREVLTFDLTRAGFRVIEASGGFEALEVIAKTPVDVILSDVRMPNGSGLEMLDRVKARDAESPVVMFTSGFTDVTLDEIYDRGAEAMFTKPIQPDVLAEVIRQTVLEKNDRWRPRSSRIEAKSTVVLTSESPQDGRAETFNLGRGGMFVAVAENQPLPLVGEALGFSVALVGRKMAIVEGSGIVRWVRADARDGAPRGFGLEFSHLADGCRTAVAEFVNDVKTKAFIPRG